MDGKLDEWGFTLAIFGIIAGLAAMGFTYDLHLPPMLDGALCLLGFSPVLPGVYLMWKSSAEQTPED